jgi:hypothetical protein
MTRDLSAIVHHVETTLRAAAPFYASLGLAIFPCVPRRKEPLTPHGHLDATTDLDMIERRWRRRPDANVGIACAKSRVVVLDFDPRIGSHEEQAAFFMEYEAALAQTWAVETSRGGRHFYFAWPPTVSEEPRFARALVAGVEIKGNGYVLAPPSVHPLGHVYRWVRGQSPRDLALDLGHRPAACPPALWHRMLKPAYAAVAATTGPVTDSLLAELCQRRGIVRGAIGNDRLAIMCPWSDEHSMDGGTGEAVLFAPQVPGGLGGFYCAHQHCSGRGSRELFACFTPDEVARARAALTARGGAAQGHRSVLIEVAC